MLCTLVFL